MPRARCVVNRRTAHLGDCVDLCPALDEKRADLAMAALGRPVQRRHRVSVGLVDDGHEVQQKVRDGLVAAVRRGVQRGPPVLCGRGGVKSVDLVSASSCGLGGREFEQGACDGRVAAGSQFLCG
eukprot:352729-Chlamydomonas_euryale.AAC.3